jgi:sortase A
MTDSDSSHQHDTHTASNDPAVNLIREKIDALYTNEPNVKEEVAEVASLDNQPSKHQAYMKELTESGRSLAEIQTAWHNYYVSLPDAEKHQVWKEFYAAHDAQKETQHTTQQHKSNTSTDTLERASELTLPEARPNSEDSKETVSRAPAHSYNSSQHKRKPHHTTKTVAQVKTQLLSKASSNASGKLKAKQHFQSLLFGVGMGSLVVLILLFSFFNDRFIAPFITPSKAVSATPILIDSNGPVDPSPKVVIPKINVEIPVVYDEPSVEENAIQNALERGVVHYATTPKPGEKGNSVIFGHSSNNILNKGQYKFAFVLLNRLEIGDTFYLNKDGVRYAYRIYEKRIVKPTEVDVLNSTTKPATATLITCDPPGTSLNRLIVIGEQVSPDPTGNKASTANKADAQTTIIPSNAPSLWERIKSLFS